MPGLQRSVATFRRSGSSGLVWDDTFFFEVKDQKSNDEHKGEENKDEIRELRASQSMGFLHSSMMVAQTNRVSSGLPPPSPSKSYGRKFFRVNRKNMSTKEPKVSSF